MSNFNSPRAMPQKDELDVLAQRAAAILFEYDKQQVIRFMLAELGVIAAKRFGERIRHMEQGAL